MLDIVCRFNNMKTRPCFKKNTTVAPRNCDNRNYYSKMIQKINENVIKILLKYIFESQDYIA